MADVIEHNKGVCCTLIEHAKHGEDCEVNRWMSRIADNNYREVTGEKNTSDSDTSIPDPRPRKD